MNWFLAFAGTCIAVVTAALHTHWHSKSPQIMPDNTPPVAPNLPATAPIDPDSITYSWDTPQHNYHNARVLCDNAGLSLAEKNIICACLYQESEFYNYLPNGLPVTHQNKSPQGQVLSTDFGIAQINDFYHIGPGKDFPSVDFLLANPDKAVQFMIDAFQHGKLSMWVSYSSGEYRVWLSTESKMWSLAS